MASWVMIMIGIGNGLSLVRCKTLTLSERMSMFRKFGPVDFYKPVSQENDPNVRFIHGPVMSWFWKRVIRYDWKKIGISRTDLLGQHTGKSEIACQWNSLKS